MTKKTLDDDGHAVLVANVQKAISMANKYSEGKRADRAKRADVLIKELRADLGAVVAEVEKLRTQVDELSSTQTKLYLEASKVSERVNLLFSAEALSRAHSTEVAQRLERLRTALVKAANG
jgi:regulator of replication initiation timing